MFVSDSIHEVQNSILNLQSCSVKEEQLQKEKFKLLNHQTAEKVLINFLAIKTPELTFFIRYILILCFICYV